MTGATPETGRWQYLPALDGVRALAVVAVVLFHFWPDTFVGGFVGVDVFFVMSGFLITGILADELGRTGGVDLRAFWGRRIRRLVPAVVVLVAVTSVTVSLLGTGSARQLGDSIGALTWTTNLVEVFFGGSQLWAANTRTVLDHLWSLAIEEQFYLLWPVVAAALLRRVSSRWARVGIVLALVGASALAMGLVGGVDAYYRTDTRAFELLAGAALFLTGAATKRIAPVVSIGLGVAGLGGLVAFVVLVGPLEDWLYPWGFLLITASGAALVLSAAAGPPGWTAPFTWPPIRRLGQVSYGVYLWHIPVQRILSPGRTGLDGVALTVARLAALALLVELSYRFVEEPFRRGRARLDVPRFVAAYALVAVALIPLAFTAADDVRTQWVALDRPPKVAEGSTRVLVLGDLLAAAVADGLDDDAGLAVWSLAEPGCPGLAGDGVPAVELLDRGEPLDVGEICEHWQERWTNAVERFDPDLVVIANGYWDTLAVGSGTRLQGTYRRLVAAQHAAVVTDVDQSGGGGADRSGPEVVLVAVDDWTQLIDRVQRPVAERLDAAANYSAAVEAGASGLAGVTVVTTAGDGGWDELRDLAPQLGLR